MNSYLQTFLVIFMPSSLIAVMVMLFMKDRGVRHGGFSKEALEDVERKRTYRSRI